MTSFKIGRDNGSVFLLSGSIPNVEFGKFIMQIDIFDFKINGGDLSLFFSKKITLSKSPEKSSFTNITISDKNKLIFFLLTIGEISLLNHDDKRKIKRIKF